MAAIRKSILLITILLGIYSAHAQLPDGSTVPDFTFTDLDGNSQNLYSYLDAGKHVALEVSATWCHPCWLYHTSRTMDTLYNLHDNPGDASWKILFVEGDGGTTLGDLQGTGSSTQGNWVSGTSYPIMNPPSGSSLSDFLTGNNINAFPTLFLVCPNKKIYQDTLNTGLKPPVSRWEYTRSMCINSGIDDPGDRYPLTVFPSPATSSTTLYFSLNKTSRVTISISSITGQMLPSRTLLLEAGDHRIQEDISNYPPGLYIFTVTDGSGRSSRQKVVIQ